VILTYVPNVGSAGGKVRPALIVQADHNNARLNETIVAAITSNISHVQEATQLLAGALRGGVGVGSLPRGIRAVNFGADVFPDQFARLPFCHCATAPPCHSATTEQ
jgi:hypothetical protein